METERTRKSKYLFQVILDIDQQQSLTHLHSSLLLQFIQRCSKQFHKNIQQKKAVYIFLANYKNIMQLHSKIYANEFSVNICLHFALLLSYQLLKDSRYSEAKLILKQTQTYESILGKNQMLMSLCLSNLAALYLKNDKIYKSLNVGLRGISYLEHHLEQLKQSNNRKQIIEDGVVFVNLLQLTQRALQRIIRINHKRFFKTLFKIVNRLGYSFANKYLGSDSILTKKFVIKEDSIYLPVFLEDDQNKQIPQPNQFEVRIARQLENIYQMLANLNLGPQIYYIKVHAVDSKSESSIQIAVPQPDPEPGRVISHSQKIMINNWQTDISILKQVNSVSKDNIFSFLGNLHFNCKKGKQTFNMTITEQRLIKILNVINIYNILPYECELKRLSNYEFIRKLLINYLFISDDKELIMFPKAKSIIDVFQITFLGEKCYLFINHIYFSKFRISICSIMTSQTFYIDIDLKHLEINSSFQVKNLQSIQISSIYNKYNPQSFESRYKEQYSKMQSLIILHPKQFKAKIITLVQGLQKFLREQQQNNISQINTVINVSGIYHYFQYTEIEGKGTFYCLKYHSNANHIELTVKNTFQTYNIDGLAKVKGTAIYSPQHFLRDFGISLKMVKSYLPAFAQIIVQKYNLKTYQSPIQEYEQDRFEQNAINQLQFTSKFYQRKFIQFQDFQLPITIQVLSINNYKPIGIRVTAYQPIKCIQSGIFIHLTPQYWQKPIQKTEQNKGQQSFSDKIKTSTEDYNFKKSYFLTAWMKNQGFNKIYKRLIIINRSLQIRGLNSKFCRIDQFLID